MSTTDERHAIETTQGESCAALRLQLQRLARSLPQGATVNLDAIALERLAGPLSDERGAAVSESDLTVAEAAARLKLSTNRVRALIAEGSLEAYRVAGRGGWRITSDALARFRAAGMPPAQSQAEGPAARVDLGRWRRQKRAA
jgi:excisionase family DNA binding protein